ncbi:endonuclease/exonuclease/phosphatase family protein [Enterococcus hulanensis]|uniref:endonuclease/exonuclease/phosphatase family protein n=1 Tax=Enterococcus hulanensis TaxID=2559929 RepID=UPI00288C9AC2|nr:endonuclease/exonuclease/phosphatase family protein [Enterococcus hulanensis]MDT2662901.1 endonuclease/exonuclease/phosphatase family protein [Enterococcus hulanensis]
MEADDQKQLETLANQIAKEEYDFIGLQEVNQLMTSPLAKLDKYFQPTSKQQTVHQDNFLFCLVEKLKSLGCYYYWSWSYNHVGYDIYHEGTGLLSRTPMKAENYLISERSDPTDYHTRRAVIGETIIDGQKIIVANGHFSWWQNDKTAFAFEWGALEKVLSEKQGSLIIMGDFNNDAKINGEGYDMVKGSSLKLQDAFVAAKSKFDEYTVEEAIDGWSENAEKLRIDYIFTSQDFNVVSYRIVFNDKNESIISDHYGVEVMMD